MTTALENSYAQLPERFYERTRPEGFEKPELILFNSDLAKDLGLSFLSEAEITRVFSGQELMPGSDPIAQAYAGFQFGHPVPQLGDGRAHLLGEIKGYDIQLKGSGRTQFSRRGDGRSALGPVMREFLVSEGMHAFGVPTTRALCAVATGEEVLRSDGMEPGGILTRVAESHLRVGTFQYFAFQNDLEALELLLDYTIERHYPEIQEGDLSERCLQLLQLFAHRQGDLVAQWYGLGFIHGVMNTDNCSMAGITIDYGPCAFMDEFKFQKVFSSIDEKGRYAYGNQMPIVEWNIFRLADCLIPLIDKDENTAVKRVTETLKDILSSFPTRIYKIFAEKLGLVEFTQGDEDLVKSFLNYLEKHSLDFTISFSHLEELLNDQTEHYPKDSNFDVFVQKWKDRKPQADLFNQVNPIVIPRNHQIQRVIDRAYEKDYEPFKQMWQALKNPFDVADEHRHFTKAPQPNERVLKTFCGT